MASRFSTDLWQVGIAHTPIGACVAGNALASATITWLPQPKPFAFIADPFGIWHEGALTVFVEALDYRVKRGEIHYYRYSPNFDLLDQGVALRMPYHLSYPQILRDGDAIYLLPEAYRSGTLTLYRAARFPDQWVPAATLLDQPAIDASIIRYQDRWWMFYALPGPEAQALRELHIAYADYLTGPWLPHTGNPVRNNRHSGRPGGTPFVQDGALYLPTQDCTNDYGEAVQLLRIDILTPDVFSAEPVQRIAPQRIHPGYTDGLHTLASPVTSPMGDSGYSDVTLFDVKHLDHSGARRWINLQRRVRRLAGMA